MTKQQNWKEKIVSLLEDVLEHRLFKPITISIIITFVIFNVANYTANFFRYHSKSLKKQYQPETIDININNQKKFDTTQTMQYRIKSGDTLLQVLVKAGIEESEISEILRSIRKEFNPGGINIGHKIILDYNIKLQYDSRNNKNTDRIIRHAIVNKIRIVFSPESELLITKNSNGSYQTTKIKHELSRRILKYSGNIKNSLFVDGIALGASPTTMMNMINLYSYDVDFQRDLQKDNKFEILVESFYTKDGQKVRDGEILFSSLSLSNRKIELYAHKIRGQTEYFNAKGESIRKSLLRTPVNGARISSGFGMRRHPVLGYSKLHKGIDFAAPTGTPIFAAGDGVIVYRGRFGGYGNYIKIKHNAEFSTAYAHASRFSKNFRIGSRVKQGNVIAYVGTTGRSTGPHLHYEILKRGIQINPKSVKTTSGVRLSGRNLEEFRRSKANIDALLSTTKVNIKS